MGGLAQQGVSNDTPVPHPGEDRVNNVVFRQQLLTQLPPSLDGVCCSPDRWLLGCILSHSEWAQSRDQHLRVVRIPGHQPYGQSGKWAERVGPGKPAHQMGWETWTLSRPTLYESAALWRFWINKQCAIRLYTTGSCQTKSRLFISSFFRPGTRALPHGPQYF